MDGEAWWPAIYGVAQIQTRLKRLSSSSSERFYLSLKQQKETNYKCEINFPSLYKIKGRFLLNFSVAMMIPGST